MKNYITIILFSFMFSCNAQSIIYDIESDNIPYNIPNGAYIKDINNVLNKFQGNWMYQDNLKNFTVNLSKEKTDLQEYYKDLLKGKYKYTNNGIVIVDTNNFPITKSKLTGARLWEGNPNKVTLFFYDPERPKMSCEVTLTYSNTNGIEKLHWDLKLRGLPSSRDPNMNQATDFRVPTNVELIKQ
ncbi:hypothetical protein OF897_21485 [Chryseobacterium formosus]|uniref:DUF6705 domain-containing protein n=1 Tax=Chryseobacterium formosus TaxID=1537363 RepID=A0ABT3XXU3_9FLAO|nr:DUF6705 family protein [Chryseobacterium formosus]MCX8526490.1 hypothetical protein [Chryseobacterium formosus]